MSDSTRSPGIRRSPRLQGTANPLRASNLQQTQDRRSLAPNERRRLQFHDEVELAPVPNSTNLNPYSAFPNRDSLTQNSAAAVLPEDFIVARDEVSEEVGSELVRISEANDMSRMYCFFSTKLCVQKLRSILKSWDCRQIGRKDSLVAKCTLQLKLFSLSGMRLNEVMSGREETSRYQSWLRAKLERDEIYPQSIKKVPNEEKLILMLRNSESSKYRTKRVAAEQHGTRSFSERDGRVRTNAPAGSPVDSTETPAEHVAAPVGPPISQPVSSIAPERTNFGINEFARLLITMRDDEDAQAATVAMGQELTRCQLDLGVSRGDFWTIVEYCFKDPNNRRFLNLAGAVDDVNSSLPPLVHRTGTFLKDKFNDAKADFTQYCERWEASEQNDPDKFKKFFPTLPNSKLTALGRRMMVMFVCTRKGTAYEEDHFTNLCYKFIPGGGGRDEGARHGGRSGGGRSSGRGSLEGQSRKRSSQEADGLREIASSFSKIASSYDARKRNSGGSESKKQLDDYSHRLKKIKILENVGKMLSTYSAQEPCEVEDVEEAQEIDNMSTEKSVTLALRELHRDMKRDLLRKK